ncbi:hypothetical protein FACS1894105_11290 [Clostridia bacterium]|nr:hypothetical protein FACS1894105_11290 [Clostridia bacterium]GHV11723.1 hypothetical protein FACS1894219_03340 [Clostridia bacterium]
MSTNATRIHDKFAYFAEDFHCRYCKHYRGKKGCARIICCCADERIEAAAHNKIKRKRGWFRQWDM